MQYVSVVSRVSSAQLNAAQCSAAFNGKRFCTTVAEVKEACKKSKTNRGRRVGELTVSDVVALRLAVAAAAALLGAEMRCVVVLCPCWY